MRRLLLSLCLTPLMSCGTSSSIPTAADSGVASDDTAPTGDAGTDETRASCGINVGDILCDLPLEGYVRDGVATGLATEAPYVSAKLSDIVAQGTQKYAFIWTSAHW